jgi:hypothetical protein
MWWRPTPAVFVDRLPRPAQPLAELLYEELDALEALKGQAKKAMLAEAKRHPDLESRTKRWAPESPIEGWFPPLGGERSGFGGIPSLTPLRESRARRWSSSRGLEDPVEDDDVVVEVGVEAGPEAVQEGDGADLDLGHRRRRSGTRGA